MQEKITLDVAKYTCDEISSLEDRMTWPPQLEYLTPGKNYHNS